MINFQEFEFNNSELKTKYGIDQLELMIEFITVIEAEADSIKKRFSNFEKWIQKQINRDLQPKEKIALAKGLLDYSQSEPATNERENAMKFLFNAKFLQ